MGFRIVGCCLSGREKRVAFEGTSRTVIDGPFAGICELVAGFWLGEVKDMDEAAAWVMRCPALMLRSGKMQTVGKSTAPAQTYLFSASLISHFPQ